MIKIAQYLYESAASTFLKKILALWPYIVLVLILTFAFYIRSHTFWIPHWQGDQSQYVILASKWEAYGLKGYNLSGIDVGQMEVDIPFINRKGSIYFPVHKENAEGYIYQSYTNLGLGYYKMPLYYKPPLFPILLSYSHRLFAKQNQLYTIVASNLGEWARQIKPEAFFKAQFWAVIVPLTGDLLLILLTFFLGRYLFGNLTGLYACFLLSIHPVNILCANRILLESTQAFLALISIFLFLISSRRQSLLGFFVSGIFGGLCILMKQNGLFLLVLIGIYTVIFSQTSIKSFKDCLKLALNRPLLFYSLGVLLVCTQWFLAMFQAYGNPFWCPSLADTIKEKLGWFRLLEKRPHQIILFPVGIPYMCPLFVCAYFSFEKMIIEARNSLARKRTDYFILFLWLWVLVFFTALVFQPYTTSREHRYLLIAYPALAILAGERICRFRSWAREYFVRPSYVDILIIAVFILCVFWSVPMAWKIILAERTLIRQPF